MTENKKRIIKKYGFISFLLIFIIISILLMVRYQVEGETNMPFKIEKIIIKSTIDAKNRESENLWDVGLAQNNDIYIYIEKNEERKKEENIKNIKLEDITITEKNKIGEISVLLPTSNDLKTLYKNSVDNYLNKTIEYTGNSIDSLEKQEICSKGGIVAFRVANNNIGEFVSNEGTELSYNGTLLQKANIKEEDLKLKIKMDICIETVSSKKYSSTIDFELPVDSFGESGIVDKTITDFSALVFKRI